MNNYLIIDIENNNSNKYARKAGNFLYDDIVAIGLKYNWDTIQSIYCYKTNEINNELQAILNHTDLLIGHNIKHDLLFLWKYPELQEWLKQGGKIWDTQYAEYCLTGQQNQYASLRDIAVTKYGCQERQKYIDDLLFNRSEEKLNILKALSDAGYWKTHNIIDNYWNYQQVSDLPKELVLKDVEQDVLDTEQVYLQQVKFADEKGMTTLIELEMDSILATTEMEYNGMYIQKDILIKNQQILEQELNEQYKKLDTLVKRYWKNA